VLTKSSEGWSCECCGAFHSALPSPLDRIVVIGALPEREGSSKNLSKGLPKYLPVWRIRKIQSHIDGELRSPLTIESMAAHLGMSAAHFSRAFKESIGASPHRYLMIRRVIRAHHLLRATNLSLADIAVECGLADQAHLTRLFGRAFGMPPGAWRRHNTNYSPTPTGTPSVSARGAGDRYTNQTTTVRPHPNIYDVHTC
jgi:AraC-like DNA-binding protein